MPLASSDGKGGYGVFQITPPGADIRFWSWKANVDRGKEIIAEKKSITDTFTNSQINQWTAWNAIHDPDVSEPTKTIYSGITFSLYPSGAEKSYHDANTIKFYNGLGGVEPISHFLVWKNNEPPYDSRPGWLIREYAEYYVSEGKTTKIYYVRLICETIP
ncbi:MAG: hypothetical protein HPY51_14700 [Candidatus Omnitrophica bacterium]|nr:hypothetical protein [Candidatus Omnitrophota bacterium]